MLDPVRFITNLSTGEMGYAVAREAKRRGYQVTLISGPTALRPPQGIGFIPIVTVEDLSRALQKHFFESDVLIMTAAVGDFIPVKRALQKIHRQKRWKVEFREAPDLLRGVARKKGGRLAIGFSLETENWLERSRQKLKKKNLDGIVANFYTSRHNPFGHNAARVAFIDRQGIKRVDLPSKSALAKRLLGWIERLKKYY